MSKKEEVLDLVEFLDPEEMMEVIATYALTTTMQFQGDLMSDEVNGNPDDVTVANGNGILDVAQAWAQDFLAGEMTERSLIDKIKQVAESRRVLATVTYKFAK